MRILHRKSNQVFKDIEILLKIEEAEKLIGYLEWLIENPQKGDACHMEADLIGNQYQKELTVAVYTDDNIQHFDERTKKLILEDK